jgi:hypothetical protein
MLQTGSNRREREREESLVTFGFAGETEVLGENPTQCRFIRHKYHITCPGIDPRGAAV